MTTQLGDVKIQLTLDTEKAKRDAEEVRKSFERQQQAQRAALAKVNYNSFEFQHLRYVLQSDEAREAMRTRSLNRYDLRQQDRRSTIDRLKEFVSPKKLLGETNYGMLKEGIAGGAALYAAASVASKLLPTMTEFAKGAGLGDVSGPVREQIEQIRAAFTNLEARVSSYFTAAQKAGQVFSAGARLGAVPNPVYYYDQFQKLDTEEYQLTRKFDEFKNNDVARATGEFMRRSFSHAFNR